MKLVSGFLLATSLVAGGALAERLTDPLERHQRKYELEGPHSHSEIFYLTSNWYDQNGDKHDDRVGDTLLIVTPASAAGGIALGIGKRPSTAAEVTA